MGGYSNFEGSNRRVDPCLFAKKIASGQVGQTPSVGRHRGCRPAVLGATQPGLFQRPNEIEHERGAVFTGYLLERRMRPLRIRNNTDGEKRSLHARRHAGRVRALHILGVGAIGVMQPIDAVEFAIELERRADIALHTLPRA